MDEAIEHDRVDTARVRSFAGLVVGRLGPRAYGLISGTYLVLLVNRLTGSLFAVTFALTAHRLIAWAVYPVIGRRSDHSHSRFGRRTPFMAGGLGVMAVCTWFYPEVNSYWGLVALIIVARQARVAYSLPSFAATPEIFGRSRWIRALIAVGIGSMVIGVLIRVTIIATWDRDDASTWPPAFRLAAAFMALSAVAILLFVREAPEARKIPEARTKRWRDEVAELFATPNARAIALAAALGIAASGATDRAYPVYAQEVLGASGSDLAWVGFTAIPTGIFAIVGGIGLARVLTRRQVALAAPLVGALFAILHIFATTLWQSVLLGVLGAPLGVAAVIALGPFALSLVPRTGGMGERMGVLLGPIGLIGVLTSFISALTFDHLIRDYRIIWLFAAVLTGLIVVPLSRLRIPDPNARTNLGEMIREIRSATSARGDREGGAGLFEGTVTRKDADATVLFDRLRELAARYGWDDGTPDGVPADKPVSDDEPVPDPTP